MKKKFQFDMYMTGEVKETEFEKTIMLVGATGSGKSTLIDGMVNYLMGVNFDDPCRFTLIQLEDEELKTDNQVLLRMIYLFCSTHYKTR